MKDRFWRNKKVLVTGAGGFLGHHLVPMLRSKGAILAAPAQSACDLRIPAHVDHLFDSFGPELVIHLAVHGGGIGHMKSHPGSIFYDNIMMDTLIVDACRKYRAKKFVGIGTVCSYPKFTPVPFREKYLWDGYPEETNAPYGLAKKMMLVQTQAYRQEFDLRGIHLLLTNMYGPHDRFDARSSHVIPALILKFMAAVKDRSPEVVAWGTGNVSREFLYAEDGARAVMMAAEGYDSPEPLNIGSGREVKIRDLARMIGRLSGYRGKIRWDASKPDGQPRRRLDTSRARRALGFQARVSLDHGLRKTIQWYRRTKNS